MERKVRDSCGKSASRGDPAGAKRRGPTARGKRVPGVEIITHTFLNVCQVLITEVKKLVVPS
ncbi:hypothetical protein [Peribacillus sp. NPDC096448]|uniref:hypothetical protein n=1 Tax=Peribacillus sp. NPDC096448 TaxID=3364395 RepID=UPI0037F28321